MNKYFKIALVSALFVAIAGLFAKPATASHGIGGNITYRYLSPNTYLVQFDAFRDCSGIQIGNMSLEVRDIGNNPTQGCAITAINVPMTEIPGLKVNPRPYCIQQNQFNICDNSNQQELFETIVYQCTLVVSRPSRDWRLGCTIANRPQIANLAGSPNMYTEASINNLNSIINTSPQFRVQDVPINFVFVGQEFTFSFNSSEPDGDSLSYEMVPSLSNCGQEVNYADLPTGVISAPSGCTPVILGSSSGTTYSPTNPILSLSGTPDSVVRLPGLGCFAFYKPKNRFNPFTGEFTFTPQYFVPNATAASGRNKYVFAIRVNEWRRVNGVVTLVGWVRRDVMVIVKDSPNKTPNVGVNVPPIFGSTVRNDSILEIKAQACNYTRATLNFFDPDSVQLNNQLTVTYPEDPNFIGQPDGLPIDYAQWTLIGNNTGRPRVELVLTPGLAQTGQVYQIPVRVQDNGCPIRATLNRVIVIRFVNDNKVVALSRAIRPDTICQDGSAIITARIDRPTLFDGDSSLYQVTWTSNPAGPNGGLPNDPSLLSYTLKGEANLKPLRVNPKEPTTYFAKIENLKIQFRGCEDTSTLKLFVAPVRPIQVRISPDSICPGNTTVVKATITRPGIYARKPFAYRVRWSGDGVPKDTLISNYTLRGDTVTLPFEVTPSRTGRLKIMVTQIDPRITCTDSTIVPIIVRPEMVASFDARYSQTDEFNSVANNPFLQLRNMSNDAGYALGFRQPVDSVRWSIARVMRDSAGAAILPYQYKQFSTKYSPEATIDTLIEGEYAVKLWVASVRDTTIYCQDSTERIITVNPFIALNNIITINSDNKNDNLVVAASPGTADLVIFNRWGRQVKRIAGYTNDYKGDDLPTGIYFYQLEGTFRDKKARQGWFEVVRQ